MEPTENSSKQPNLIPPLPRDSRGSLGVFTPSTFSTQPVNPAFRPQPIWENLTEQRGGDEADTSKIASKSGLVEEITSWMSLKYPAPSPALSSLASSSLVLKIPGDQSGGGTASPKPSDEGGVGAKRSAEWGLVQETGKPQGLGVRNSDGDDKAEDICQCSSKGS